MKLSALAAMFLLAVPAVASAEPAIIMNGVNISGVRSQKFANVNVEFDAAGNIIIDAPQYQVIDPNQAPADPGASKVVVPQGSVAAPAPAANPAAGPVVAPRIDTLPANDNPTYIVATFSQPGLLGHVIDVYVNGMKATTFGQGKAQDIFNITSKLVKGKNTIEYRMVMAADSGTSFRATVDFSLAKQTGTAGGAVELSGQYAPISIKGSDGPKTYTVEFIVP